MSRLALLRCRADCSKRRLISPLRMISTYKVMKQINEVNKDAKFVTDVSKRQKTQFHAVLRVLGTGASGTSGSLIMDVRGSRYLFNCGDGLDRQMKAARQKLVSLQNVFLTSVSSKCISDLSSILFYKREFGQDKCFNIHGPKGIDIVMAEYNSAYKFQNSQVEFKTCEPEKTFSFPFLTVDPVILRRESKTPGSKTSVPECNRSAVELNFDSFRDRQRFSALAEMKKQLFTAPEEVEHDVSIAYICCIKHVPRAGIDTEKCVALKVPPGPALLDLLHGKEVTLEDGRILKPSDITQGSEYQSAVIVVDCPCVSYLHSLVSSDRFKKYQTEGVKLFTIVHLTPSAIMKEDRYLKWMRSFPQDTKHLVVNDSNSCFGYGYVTWRQDILKRLNPLLFPHLSGVNLCSKERELHPYQFVPAYIPHPFVRHNVIGNNESASAEWSARWGSDTSDLHLLESRHMTEIDLSTNVLDRSMEHWWNESATQSVISSFPEFKDIIGDYHARVKEEFGIDLKQIVEERKSGIKYPQIVFLGTSSRSPSTYRNCSGILLRMSEDKSILLDCAQGTLMQLRALYSQAELLKILCSLRAVYISHPHTDHHHGIVCLLRARRAAVVAAGNPSQTLIILAPQVIANWLSVWHNSFEECLSHTELVLLSRIEVGCEGQHVAHIDNMFLKELNMELVRSCTVDHYPFSYGVTFLHEDGWKITYSGDTRYSPNLVELGLDSDLLIHEATYGRRSMSEVAWERRHSTIADAERCCTNMRAKFMIMTHFSLRYSFLADVQAIRKPNVATAFDFMVVSLEDLFLLPMMSESLVKLFKKEMFDATKERQMFIRKPMESNFCSEHNSRSQ